MRKKGDDWLKPLTLDLDLSEVNEIGMVLTGEVSERSKPAARRFLPCFLENEDRIDPATERREGRRRIEGLADSSRGARALWV
jgi:hypothetical protein